MLPPRPLRPAVLTLALFALALPASASAGPWTKYDRPAANGIVTDHDVPLTMSDGTVLVADVLRPDKPGRYPVLVTQTPYNKATPISFKYDYLVKRGYVQVVADVRGTGGSQGQWDSFGPDEQRDGPEIVEWAARQPWSDGNVGTIGPSYMGFTQLLTAAQRPPHLRAIFPIVPMGDGYRDITFSGGQTNVSFIPLWLGLVGGAGLVPPTYALSGNPDDLLRGSNALASHAVGLTGFPARTVAGAVSGGDTAYDGEFWRTRSPLEVVDRINVPAFVIGGLHDLFQRGTPLIYERLKRNVDAHLLMGPWTHLTSGDGLPDGAVPHLDQIALRWFDQHLKGTNARADDMPRVTQYTYGGGFERYETQPDWPHPRLAPTRRYLRAGHALGTTAPAGAETPESFLQHPVSGICTQSTSQWTAGATEALPCTNDNRLNEPTTATYTTPPLDEPLRLNGPLLANLWITTTAHDAVVNVRITDVAPNGASKELSGGWLAASFRAVDDRRSRWVRGERLQPWHPFTKDSVLPVQAGEPVELGVEVFPINAVIAKGHRLRVAVGPADFPHAIPPLPQFADSLAGTVRVLHDTRHASYVALPTLGSKCKRAKVARGSRVNARCRSLRVPQLVRR
jgi:hypothetical protein